MKNKSPNLIKAEDPKAYAELANSGILLGYPVKIHGKSHRPDNNIQYHSTIKDFDPAKDHPHAIHELAQHLPLNPPDVKNTQIEPVQFKDRNGNDVYAIKLKGNSAEKLREHHSKFAHMGVPTNYEWHPHISVPKDVWDKIKSSGAATAHEAHISFGPAELKKGPQTLKTYHHAPDTNEPRVPDESDFTAKMEVPKTQKSEDVLGPKPLTKPYVSEAQRRWAHTPTGKKALGGNAGVHEWDEATKGKALPEKVEKGKPLEKGAIKNAAIGLGMLGAAAGAGHSTNVGDKGPSYNHQKMLNSIAQVESRGGADTNHKPTAQGQAFGKYALMPNVIHDTIKAHPDLKTKHGKALALTGSQLHNYMQDNKGLEDVIADRHLKHLEQHFGNNIADLGHSWLNGIVGTNRAKNSGTDTSKHWHAQKVINAYNKGNI